MKRLFVFFYFLICCITSNGQAWQNPYYAPINYQANMIGHFGARSLVDKSNNDIYYFKRADSNGAGNPVSKNYGATNYVAAGTIPLAIYTGTITPVQSHKNASLYSLFIDKADTTIFIKMTPLNGDSSAWFSVRQK